VKVDTIAIRRRARAHWYAKRRTEATLAASFDTYQLLAEIARLERRLTAMQAERRGPKPARVPVVTRPCECGCGAKVRRRFANGHNLSAVPAVVQARDAAARAAVARRAA